MKVTLIHNPDAGDENQPSAEALWELIDRAGYTISYQSSKNDDWANALKKPCDVVAIAGGDGIVGAVAKKLIGRQVPIAVLPMGTANNIATTLGLIDKPLRELVAAWPTAPRVKFDVGEANGPWNTKYFVEGLGMGLFTETMYRLDATNNVDLAHVSDTQEKVKSALEILRERLPSFTPNCLQIMLDGRDMSGEYVLVEVMNISYIGPNLCLAPHASPSDGFLDIVMVPKEKQESLLQCLSYSIEGKQPYPNLTLRKAHELKIAWDGFTVHIDDEVWPATASEFPISINAIELKLNHHALEFLAAG
jgi:diacylglycerol kinase family enzyme